MLTAAVKTRAKGIALFISSFELELDKIHARSKITHDDILIIKV